MRYRRPRLPHGAIIWPSNLKWCSCCSLRRWAPCALRCIPAWMPLAGVLAGGYMCTGGAGVFNMILDTSARMKRTARRPLVTGRVSVRRATLFGSVLGVGAFVVLWLTTNLLTAVIGVAGLAFYVLVYTLWLKRSTWQNIVIGGVAGASAATPGMGSGNRRTISDGVDPVCPDGTPVHFWALAFLVKDQYAAVGVPMAPSVLGTQGTLRQMLLYTLLTVLTSLVPLQAGSMGERPQCSMCCYSRRCCACIARWGRRK